MLRLTDVSKSYEPGKRAVDGITLEVKAGEIFGFLGPNGAGKTTTIKMIVGILRPDEGRIEVNGHDLAKDPVAAKKQMGYVPDESNLWEKITGAEYLNFVADVYGVPGPERASRAKELLDIFEMTEAVSDPIGSYSRGMRQKIATIASLLHRPRLWILDEPMMGLDPRSSYLMKVMMRSHADQGGAVFFSTHVLEVAERLCDRVGIIHQGKLRVVGTVGEIKGLFAKKEDETLEEVFLKLTEVTLPKEQLESIAR
ncbi:MAG TPA: ABC transporter ATP-binding protein [Clostridia bacterium]|nr:ABC transporter ATP-binding protein [Clostridia bacterium]